MRILIVSDIHENKDYLQGALVRSQDADHVVCHGDYWDAWVWRPEDFCAVTSFVLKHLTEKNWTLLVGNHDLQYLWPLRNVVCSGYEKRRDVIISQLFTDKLKDSFKFLWHHGKYLVSHAGIVKDLYKCPRNVDDLSYVESMDETLRQAVKTGAGHPWLNAGFSRGGSQTHGGILWADWSELQEPLAPWTQIVGHTHHKTNVRQSLFGSNSTQNICLDTEKHYCWIEENGELIFEELK